MNEKVLSIIVKAKDEASRVMANIGDHADKFSDGMKKVGLVVGAAGVAVTAFAKNSNDFLRETVVASNRLARETGMTAEESSKLLAVTKRLGLEAGELSVTFGTMSKHITEARNSSGEMAIKQADLKNKIEKTKIEIDELNKKVKTHGDTSGEVRNKIQALNIDLQNYQRELEDTTNPLQKMNVETKNADGTARGFHEILLQVADRFKEMPNGAEKTALALQLFGRSGKELLPLLNQGSEGIRQLEERAEKLGLTLTQKNVAAVSAYIEATKNMKDSTDAIKMSVGTLTAPVLTQLSQRMNEIVQRFIESDGPMKTFAINALAFGGPVLTATGAMLAFLGALVQAGPALRGLIVFMANPITLAFAAAVTVVALAAMHLRDQLGSWAAIGNVVRDGMVQLWNIVGPHLTTAVHTLGAAISSNLWPALVRLWQQVQPVLVPALQFLAAVLGSTLVVAIIGAINYLAAIINMISSFIHMLNIAVAHVRSWASSVVAEFNNARNRVASVWSSIYDAIVSPLRAAEGTVGAIVNQIAHWINNVTGKVNSFKNTVSNIRNEISKLPGFATGGFTGRGGSNEVAGVVHKGEYVIPKKFVDQDSGLPTGVGGAVFNMYGSVNLNSAGAVDRFFERLNAQKEMGNLGVGV